MEKDYTSKIKQLRNLALFKDKSDEEILQFLRAREAKQKVDAPEAPIKQAQQEPNISESPLNIPIAEFKKKYNTKLKSMQKEYGIDMNDSNDLETLKSLARHVIQSEIVDNQIITLQTKPEVDTRTLKNLGDYQKSLISTITDLQEKLGIGRRQRKEKQVDSIPQFIEIVRKRARDIWEKTTLPVRCERCEIELARYWLNFPDNAAIVHFEIECEKCKERVVFKR
jgi:hypothetical protein